MLLLVVASGCTAALDVSHCGRGGSQASASAQYLAPGTAHATSEPARQSEEKKQVSAIHYHFILSSSFYSLHASFPRPAHALPLSSNSKQIEDRGSSSLVLFGALLELLYDTKAIAVKAGRLTVCTRPEVRERRGCVGKCGCRVAFVWLYVAFGRPSALSGCGFFLFVNFPHTNQRSLEING